MNKLWQCLKCPPPSTIHTKCYHQEEGNDLASLPTNQQSLNDEKTEKIHEKTLKTEKAVKK